MSGFDSSITQDLRGEKIAELVHEFYEELKARERPVKLSADLMRALEEWVSAKNPITNAHIIFGQHIRGLGSVKHLMALQTISNPEPFHMIVIGDPSCGKSEVAQSVREITPLMEYVWATKMSAAGLTLSAMGSELAKGALPRCHTGNVIIDEFEKGSGQELGALLSSMQIGKFGIEKASLKVSDFPARCAITALANPRGDYWHTIHPKQIKQQMPFDSQALLTRFHYVMVIQRLQIKEFEESSLHQINAVMKEMSHNNFNADDIEMWKTYVNYLRRFKVTEFENQSKIDSMITAFTTSAYTQSRRFQLAIPISHRINEGILKTVKALTKSQLRNKVTINDTVKAIQLMAYSLIPCGLDADLAFKAIKKHTKVTIEVD